MHLLTRLWSALFVPGLLATTTYAAEPFRYPEMVHGKGELKYRAGLPVLVVQGSPTEIGEQVGTITKQAHKKLLNYPEDVLRSIVNQHLPNLAREPAFAAAWSYFMRTGEAMAPRFPADYRTELAAMARTANCDTKLAYLANTMFDSKSAFIELHRQFGCSVLQVEPGRSTTGAALFGRNLDFSTAGYLHEYSLVIVCKPTGKHSFVSIGFPGFVGCLSGMNDAGLCLAVLEAYSSADGAAAFDAQGVPYSHCFRELLETCTTVAEAEKALRSMKRASTCCLAICDRQHAAVFEMTPKSLAVRQAEDKLCACTNHFRTKSLGCETDCWRFERLAQSYKSDKLSLADVAKQLDNVNQGHNTLQTMIFEPTDLKLHLAIGKCPSTKLALRTIELKELFKVDSGK